MNLIKISSSAIEVTWPYIKEFVKKPLEKGRGEYELTDVYNALINGQLDLWVGVEDGEGIIGIMVTQVIHYPQFKALSIPFIGTKPHTMRLWFDYSWDSERSPILKYAKENNIKRIEGWAREGWTRITEKYGFKKYRTILIKEI